MSTETKVVSGIVIATILIIVGGLFIIQRQSSEPATLTIKPELLDHGDSPRIGSSTKVTIVEFADFECPSCAVLHPTLERLLEEDADKFTLIYRHFPIHQHSVEAASAALAAGEQGKFWEMSDKLFDNQAEWSLAKADRTALFTSYAKELGIDIGAFTASFKSSKHPATVTRDQADAMAMGINSTPTLIINGSQIVKGAVSYDTLKKIIDDAYLAQLKLEEEFPAPAKN